MRKFLSRLCLAGLVLATASMVPVAAEETRVMRSISVNGHGEARAEPDLASITMGVSSTGTTAKEALAANTATMVGLMNALETAGIAKKDITTTNFNVGPRYDYGQGGAQPPKLVGYDVSNLVTIIVRKVEGLGSVLDAAVGAGSNQIQGIMFTVSKPEALLDAARKEAITDARRKAELYAAAGGFALGQILSLSEGGGYQPPVPMLGKAMAAEASTDVPISRGEHTLGVDIIAVWEIK